MTTTATDAYEAIRAHHRALSDGLTERASAVLRAAVDGQPHEPAVADFIAYLGEEVLPHAAAEEKTIYPVVVSHTHLGTLVGEMITEHAALSMSAARLTALTDGVAAAEQAQEIAALFATHAAKENDVLLPPLVADRTVDLAELLSRMHRNLEPAAPGGTCHCDCQSHRIHRC
jgi:iron-sulfur cluster repair protein YtfE (RIC family)